MPTTVAHLFEAAGLKQDGVVRWRARLPEAGPGVYVVALSDDGDSVAAARGECPLSTAAVRRLLDVRPELGLDGQRPSSAQLAARLASCWLADEVAVYIGLAGTSLAGRVGDYYKTPLGARRPHAGGWPLKTLAVLDELWVHYAACDAVDAAERVMVEAFIEHVSQSSRAAACESRGPGRRAEESWHHRCPGTEKRAAYERWRRRAQATDRSAGTASAETDSGRESAHAAGDG